MTNTECYDRHLVPYISMGLIPAGVAEWLRGYIWDKALSKLLSAKMKDVGEAARFNEADESGSGGGLKFCWWNFQQVRIKVSVKLNIRIASPPYRFRLISDQKRLALRMRCMLCISSTQNERPRPSRACLFECARSAQTTIKISKKVSAGDSLGSINQRCQLLVQEERRYLTRCKDAGQAYN